MPRPALGRVRLTLRLHPTVLKYLGERPSAKARILLEQWADAITLAEVEKAFERLESLKSTQGILEMLDAERQGSNASSDVDESAPLEEGSAAKLGPGRSEVDAETEVTNTTRRR